MSLIVWDKPGIYLEPEGQALGARRLGEGAGIEMSYGNLQEGRRKSEPLFLTTQHPCFLKRFLTFSKANPMPGRGLTSVPGSRHDRVTQVRSTRITVVSTRMVTG